MSCREPRCAWGPSSTSHGTPIRLHVRQMRLKRTTKSKAVDDQHRKNTEQAHYILGTEGIKRFQEDMERYLESFAAQDWTTRQALLHLHRTMLRLIKKHGRNVVTNNIKEKNGNIDWHNDECE